MLAQTGLLLPTTPNIAVRAHAAQVGRSPDKGNGLRNGAVRGGQFADVRRGLLVVIACPGCTTEGAGGCIFDRLLLACTVL